MAESLPAYAANAHWQSDPSVHLGENSGPGFDIHAFGAWVVLPNGTTGAFATFDTAGFSRIKIVAGIVTGYSGSVKVSIADGTGHELGSGTITTGAAPLIVDSSATAQLRVTFVPQDPALTPPVGVIVTVG